MQVTREQGLSHIDFEIASLVPFAGKTVVSISKAALARLAARKAAAEVGGTLTSVAARAAESRVHLYDGMKAKVDKALDMAKDFLGKGYIDKGKGRFISLDGKRQVRMGDADILGHHAGGRHMNFEKLGADPITKRVRVEENIHVFLEE